MTRFATLLLPLLAGCFLTGGSSPDPFSDCRADEGDAYDIGMLEGEEDPVRIEGDTLYVWIGHGGGCETHEYQICWPDQAFMESDPVQVRLEIWHDANDDMCDAYLSQELAFDLTPLKDAWHDSYGAGPGIIVIHVDTETVEYSFDG